MGLIRGNAFFCLFFVLGEFVFSQNSLNKDIQAIKEMSGCYSITFEYAETFHTDTSYQIHKPYKAEAAAEWIFVAAEDKNRIVLQHILVARDTIVIKHWRQDWLYENKDIYSFHKNRTWKYRNLDENKIAGQWTQKVFQVDDSPRYEGSSSWVHVDGKHYWENTTDAPLPRREYTKRSDYNVMRRTNRHEIKTDGWIHEQDNLKIIRAGEKDSVLVAEKGLNTYTRIEDEKCEAAVKWWDENKFYWTIVRSQWDALFFKNEDLHLAKKIEDKFLWEKLFDLGSDIKGKNKKELTKEINTIINAFILESSVEEESSY